MTATTPWWVNHPGLVEVIVEAQDGFECSLVELATRCAETDAPILDVLTWLSARLAAVGIEIRPAVSVGSFDDPRRLIAAARSVLDDPIELIGRGEDHRQEFKSSLYFDRALAAERPDAALAELKSEGVFFSILKTISAFANSEGGDLWVGVEDSGNTVGLTDDFRVLAFSSQDRLELHLRDRIASKFSRGQSSE